jgi:hypothetical protein
MTRAFRAGTFFPTFAFAVFRDWNAYGINRAPENGAYVSFLFRRRVKKPPTAFFDARMRVDASTLPGSERNRLLIVDFLHAAFDTRTDIG